MLDTFLMRSKRCFFKIQREIEKPERDITKRESLFTAHFLLNLASEGTNYPLPFYKWTVIKLTTFSIKLTPFLCTILCSITFYNAIRRQNCCSDFTTINWLAFLIFFNKKHCFWSIIWFLVNNKWMSKIYVLNTTMFLHLPIFNYR